MGQTRPIGPVPTFQEFGPDGVAELSALFDEASDPDRDGVLARAIIECKTVAEVVALTSEV